MSFRILFIFLCLAFSHVSLKAQICGTPEATPAQLKYIQEQLIPVENNMRALRTNATIKYIPIKPFIVRKDDKTTEAVELNILQGINQTNAFYINSGIQFYVAGDFGYVDETDLYDFKQADETMLASTRDLPNVINIYYVNSITFPTTTAGQVIAGYTYLPGGSLRILMNIHYAKDDNTLPHEIGHFFNLLHTFQNNNSTDINRRELVKRTNCTVAGDLLCDTPADPYDLPGATVSNCVYTGTATDANGDTYTPPLANVMGYYDCGKEFTTGQYARITAALNGPRSTLNYTGAMPVAPTNLSVAILSNNVKLTWMDVASTEIGYFIERSTSLTGNFYSVGVTGPNVTSYIDKTPLASTTYYYRVKPVNAVASFSNTISISSTITTPAYCEPYYSSSNCAPNTPVFLNEFILSEGTTTLLSNTVTGCSSYSDFTNKTAAVTSGKSYSFSIASGIASGTSYYPQRVAIWVDLNIDGDFSDAGEQLFMSTAGPFRHTGSITIPATATTGITRLRIRSTYYNSANPANSILSDACGPYNNGEAEDYSLLINTTCVPGGTSTTVMAGVDQTTCVGTNSFNLTGSTPASGMWSGAGITAAGLFTPATAGLGIHTLTYSVTQSGCVVKSYKTITVNNCTSAAEDLAASAALTIFPNPTAGAFTIRFPAGNNERTVIKVLDIQGRLVLRQDIKQTGSEAEQSFNLEGNAPGIYLVQVITDKEVATKKILLK